MCNSQGMNRLTWQDDNPDTGLDGGLQVGLEAAGVVAAICLLEVNDGDSQHVGIFKDVHSLLTVWSRSRHYILGSQV